MVENGIKLKGAVYFYKKSLHKNKSGGIIVHD